MPFERRTALRLPAPFVALSLPLVALLGCADARTAPPAVAPAASPPQAEPGPSPSPRDTPAPAAAPIRFIEDDYPRALAEARQSGKPLFVDAWAPWCHTCVSMRSYVFPDPAVQAHARDFVWLSIDTERPANAAWMEAHPMQFWPTLWVIDPRSEAALLKWANSATPAELSSLLDDARLAYGSPGASTLGEAGSAFVRGNTASADGRFDDAIREYRASLAAAPNDWPKRANVVFALISRLSAAKESAACAELAEREVPTLHDGTARASVAQVGLECAAAAPPGDGAEARKAKLEGQVRAMAMDPHAEMLADDRSGLFETLVDLQTREKRAADARATAAAWATFLEGEAARANNPAARAVFDPHRLNAYIALGTPERAIPMLEASERDFPNDYNPPARLALAYYSMREGRDLDRALDAVDRALAKAYGPRRLRIYALKADILTAKGDRAAAAKALDAAVTEARTMPLTGSYPKLRDQLEARLRASGGGAAPRRGAR